MSIRELFADEPHELYHLVIAAGQDAGNRNMRERGDTQWNEDDWNTAAETTNKLLGEVKP